MLNIIMALKAVVILSFLGIVFDYPEYKRMKRKKNCEAGRHELSDWLEIYEIHNDNGVWERKCRHCSFREQTVSKLTPVKP